MTAGVTMRSSKGRTILYVLVGCSIAFLVYILSSTHNKLKFTEESNDKCQQQRDSLSAQLQVLYEHKSRLEKSLQNEMADKKKAESEMRTYKETAEREKMDNLGKYSELQQKYEEVKKNNLEDFNNLKSSYATLVGDKEKLEADMGKYVNTLEQQKSNEAKLQEHIKELTASLRMEEAALEQEKVKYNMAQNQLDACQSVRLQLAAQLAQSNIRSNAEAPIIMKNVMKEQRDVPLLPKGIQVPPSNVARSNLVPEKTPAALKSPSWGNKPVLRTPSRSRPVRPHSQLAPPHYQLVPPMRSHSDHVLEKDPVVNALLARVQHHDPREEYQLAAPSFRNDGVLQEVNIAAHNGWPR